MFLHSDINRIGFNNLTVKGDKAYFSNLFFSGLFEMDLRTLDWKMICILPADEPLASYRYSGIASVSDKLVISPFYSDRVIVYDLASDGIEEIMNASLFEGLNINPFNSVIVDGGKILFFPLNCGKGLEFNIDSNEFRVFIDFEKMNKFGKMEREAIFGEACILDDAILLPTWQSNNIVRFDCDTLDMQIETIPMVSTVSAVIKLNERLYIGERNQFNILCINPDGKQEKIEINVDGFVSEKGIRGIFSYENDIYIFPVKGNMIIKYNPETKNSECIKTIPTEYNEKIYEVGDTSIKCCKQISAEEVMYYSCCDGKIAILNMKTNSIREKDAKMTSGDVAQVKQLINKQLRDEINSETNQFCLSDFISNI